MDYGSLVQRVQRATNWGTVRFVFSISRTGYGRIKDVCGERLGDTKASRSLSPI